MIKTLQLKNIEKRVVLISSGQPSLNPRLVKEADTLTAAGFQVTVLYAYWNNWGTEYDEWLLAEKKWTAIRIGGAPAQKPFTYFMSRIVFKISNIFTKKIGLFKYFADFAAARSSFFLVREAKKYNADLYIAHNIGALAAAFKTAILHKKPIGFDAEDFHRQEVTDDTNSHYFKLAKYIEDKYLNQVNYITASSPMIASQYSLLYNKDVVTILNVFPKTNVFSITNKNKPLKLFWFSQTIGPNRGLELVVDALGIKMNDFELHLLGCVSLHYRKDFLLLCEKKHVPTQNIRFYDPVKPRDIFNIAIKFDIGLASETDICLNRQISLTNKLFTYLQCGLAIAASNTPAQKELLNQCPGIGYTYNDAKELSSILNTYNENRRLLDETKKRAFKIGQSELNWEFESEKFLEIAEKTINKFE